MYPPTGFQFRIIFEGLDDPNQADSHFLSISGLEVWMDRQDAQAEFTEPVPRVGFSPLLLRRSVRNQHESALTRWIFSHIKEKNGKPLPQAKIELLDDQLRPYMSWTIHQLTPLSWRLGELNAERSEVLIETIELEYKEISVFSTF
jgi:phage tail-like protein